MAVFFEAERHARHFAALERDLAATVTDPARRANHLARASDMLERLANPAEAMLIVGAS